MMDPVSPLSALASEAGIAEHWTDARQRPRQVSPDTLRAVLHALELPADTDSDIRDSRRRLMEEHTQVLPPLIVTRVGEPVILPPPFGGRYQIIYESGRTEEGVTTVDAQGRPSMTAPSEPGYHRLSLPSGHTLIAVAPPHAPTLSQLLHSPAPRCWGVAAQVYSLRLDHGNDTRRTQGFGDFGALRALAVAAAAEGADVLAISPVHAMFAAEPERSSPYAPSSRLFLNTLYADPAGVLGDEAMRQALAETDAAAMRALDTQALIDWPRAAALRQQLLRALHRRFTQAPPGLQQRFAQFCESRGQALLDHAVFEALHGTHRQPWRQWGAALSQPGSAAVRQFAADHAQEVDFHLFAQWLADASLAGAQSAGRDAGMRVGLVADLAVGDSPDGSHAWSRQADLLPGLTVGAPPDIHNPLGQNWGLTAFSPHALHVNGHGAFIEMLRASLAHAGGVRIDHILGMARLWLVPQGADASAGAYLRMPLETLLRLTALEAWRHRALVVGENLGTVPDGFNARLQDHGALGMNVLWFLPAAPADWPPDAVAMTTTHDLPTLRGWWREQDIDWRVKLKLLDADDAEGAALRQERAADRHALWQALPESTGPAPTEPPMRELLRFVSSSPCPLMLAPLEDVAAVLDQPNLPGTVATHPNWMQRLPLSVADLFADSAVQQRLDAVRLDRSGTP